MNKSIRVFVFAILAGIIAQAISAKALAQNPLQLTFRKVLLLEAPKILFKTKSELLLSEWVENFSTRFLGITGVFKLEKLSVESLYEPVPRISPGRGGDGNTNESQDWRFYQNFKNSRYWDQERFLRILHSHLEGHHLESLFQELLKSAHDDSLDSDSSATRWDKEPVYYFYRYNHAIKLYKAKKYYQAAKACAKLLQHFPQNASVWKLLAKVAHEGGYRQLALEAYTVSELTMLVAHAKQKLWLSRDDYDSKIIEECLKRELYETAIERCFSEIGFCPEYPYFWILLAAAYDKSGDSSRASVAMKTANGLFPKWPDF